MRKVFEAKDENLYDVLGLVEEELEKHDCSPKVLMMVQVIVEEIFINISHYAFEGKTGEAQIDINFDENNNFEMVFTDAGIEFDPTKNEDPDITKSAEERDIGGLGIYMVKKTMDEVIYERKDDKNVLTIRKKID